MHQLRAGAARVDITPTVGRWKPGGFPTIHDNLHARALVLESGDTTVAFVVCDLVIIRKDTADGAKAIAEEVTGISRHNISVSGTHTHYDPQMGPWDDAVEEYLRWVEGRIASAIELARDRLQPAMLAYDSGSVPGEVFNRRYWMKDGTVVFNPLHFGCKKEDIVRPAGPTDPEVGVLVVTDHQENPIAVLANYAMHYVGRHSGGISADYFGRFDRALQRMAGRDFVAIMMNGACGDINNEDFMGEMPWNDPHPFYQVERVADVVASEVYKVWRGLRRSRYQKEVLLGAASEPFHLQHREVTPEEVEAAQKTLDGQPEREYGKPGWLEQVRFHTVLEVSKLPAEHETIVQAFRIGDMAIVTLPGEIFVEIGMEVKRRSLFTPTFVAELANDSIGYIPTDQAFDEGSYETLVSHAAKGTADGFVSTALRLLNQLK